MIVGHRYATRRKWSKAREEKHQPKHDAAHGGTHAGLHAHRTELHASRAAAEAQEQTAAVKARAAKATPEPREQPKAAAPLAAPTAPEARELPAVAKTAVVQAPPSPRALPASAPIQAQRKRSMRRIAVALSKGGVGKTTTAANLAHGLSLRGAKVLLVDCDTQGQAARALGVEPPQDLYAVVGGQASPEQALAEARPGLWLLAGGRALAGLTREIARKNYGAEQTLKLALAPLDGAFDYVLVDTPPGWGDMTINALFYADEVLCPISMEALALEGLVEFTDNLNDLRQFHPRLKFAYLVPTFYDRRVAKSAEILALLKERFGDIVLSPIRYNVRLSEAAGWGKTAFEFAPGSAGAQDYQALTEVVAHGA